VTVPDLRTLLRRAKVPDWFYVTDGGLGAGECVGIEPVAGGWSVYYSERGCNSLPDTCPDEDSACRAVVRRVDRMMRQAGLGSVSAGC
jgi:hypothetical protein